MKKNILLIFPDQFRWDFIPFRKTKEFWIGREDLKIQMPNLQGLMENGTTFTNAFSSSPICAPARASLAQGKRYHDCGVDDNAADMPKGTETFYNHLKNAHYEVMSAGKLDLHKFTKFWGKEGWVKQLEEVGFTKAIDNEGKLDFVVGKISKDPKKPGGKVESYIDVKKDCNRGPYISFLESKGYAEYHFQDLMKRKENFRDLSLTEIPDEYYCDNWICDNGIKLLGETERNKPWFLQVNINGPHSPWDITSTMHETVKDRDFPKPVKSEEGNLNSDNEIRKRYVAMIENIDKIIGRLLSEIKKLGEMENTVVIFASDHGEMLGDFNLWGKQTHKNASLRIPLVITDFSKKNHGTSHSNMELQDLAATILDYAEIEIPLPESKSVKTIVEGTNVKIRDYAISSFKNWDCIQDGEYKLVSINGKFQLYNVKLDKDELNDLSLELPNVVEEMKNKLFNDLKINVQK